MPISYMRWCPSVIWLRWCPSVIWDDAHQWVTWLRWCPSVTDEMMPISYMTPNQHKSGRKLYWISCIERHARTTQHWDWEIICQGLFQNLGPRVGTKFNGLNVPLFRGDTLTDSWDSSSYAERLRWRPSVIEMMPISYMTRMMPISYWWDDAHQLYDSDDAHQLYEMMPINELHGSDDAHQLLMRWCPSVIWLRWCPSVIWDDAHNELHGSDDAHQLLMRWCPSMSYMAQMMPISYWWDDAHQWVTWLSYMRWRRSVIDSPAQVIQTFLGSAPTEQACPG